MLRRVQGKTPSVMIDKVILDELLDDVLRDYRINGKRSIDKMEQTVKRLKDEFPRMKALNFTSSVVNRYIEKRLEEKAENATINRELAALKRAFRLGLQCTPPKIVHVPYIKLLRENNIRYGFFEHEDFLELLEALPLYLKPVARFAYTTGWRKEEILSLTWKQVDLDQGTVRLEPGETKNGEGRTIYIEKKILATMKKLHAKRKADCPYVFQHSGKRIIEFRKAWKTACEESGNAGMLFHDFRRTAVRNMVRAGIPESVAMQNSGHKTGKYLTATIS